MNPNLWVWTTDWHLTCNANDHGIIGETYPVDAGNVTEYIITLAPAGVIDTGDCKDHYGANTYDAHGHYRPVRDDMPWGVVNAGVNALYPILPGNHDEVHDYSESGTVTDLSLFDQRFWSAPYHWTTDWTAARVRFIAFHTTIVHQPSVGAGTANITQAEVDWLSGQLAALPANWVAITCSHFPVDPVFGDYVNSLDGVWQFANPHPLRTLMAANASKIPCHLNGHRHANMQTDTLSGILHMNGAAMSYTIGNQLGGWMPITYDSVGRTLTFDYLLGPPSAYPRYTGFVPIVVSLPA